MREDVPPTKPHVPAPGKGCAPSRELPGPHGHIQLTEFIGSNQYRHVYRGLSAAVNPGQGLIVEFLLHAPDVIPSSDPTQPRYVVDLRAWRRDRWPPLAIITTIPIHLPPPYDRIELTDFIGLGGMGQVWLANQGDPGQELAVKFITLPSDQNEEVYVRQFVDEVEAGINIRHDGIVRTHRPIRWDVPAAGSWPRMGLVMPRYEVSLWTVIDNLNATSKKLSSALTIAWLRSLLSALEALHHRGFVHRDIKPSNILIRLADGRRYFGPDSGFPDVLVGAVPLLSDLGLVCRNGHTPLLSPGDDRFKLPGRTDVADPAEDIYALGKVLEELAEVTEGEMKLLNDVAGCCVAPGRPPSAMDLLSRFPLLVHPAGPPRHQGNSDIPRGYLEALRRALSDPLAPLVAADRPSRVDIGDLFVEPICTQLTRRDHATGKLLGEGELRSKTEDRGSQYNPRSTLPVIAALKQQPAVILGESGSGKTMVLKFLARLLADALLGYPSRDKDRPQTGEWDWLLLGAQGRPLIPVYLDLAKHVPSDCDFRDFIDQRLLTIYPPRNPTANRDETTSRERDAFQAALAAGHILFLLDNLHAAPASLRSSLESFIEGESNGCRFVMTSQPVGYESHLLGIPTANYRISPFDSEQCERLARKWCGLLGVDERADQIIASLKEVLPQSKAVGLLSYPLNVLILISCLHENLRPDELSCEAAMWDLFVDRRLGLHSSAQPVGGEDSSPHQRIDNLLQTRSVLRVLLEKLAYRSWQFRLGRQVPSLKTNDFTDVVEDYLKEREPDLWKAGYHQPMAESLKKALTDKFHFLTSPATEDSPRNQSAQQEFLFTHDQLESFLCSVELFRRPDRLSLLLRICDHRHSMKVVRLGIEYLTAVQKRPAEAVTVLAGVHALLDENPGLRPLRLWLAAEIANAISVENLRYDVLGGHLLRIRNDLVGLLAEGRLEPSERVEVGQLLSRLGDPRTGVGVRNGVPDIKWVEVPAGPFESATIDDNIESLTEYRHKLQWQTRELPGFHISMYLITYAQYRAFLDEVRAGTVPCGVWNDLPLLPEEVVDRQYPLHRYDNHPCDSVTWYEATAFCRWLSHKLKCNVRLPTVAEWEKAARGPQGRSIYPFGDHFHSSRANTADANLGRSTPVGMYPGGISPYGIHDMCGNVFEWCADASESGTEFSTRGGAFKHPESRVRISIESKKQPTEKNNHLGFRVVAENPPIRKVPKVVIVGSGAAGTITAIRLVRHSRGPLHIIRIDKEEGRINGGLAYSKATADWSHTLNLQDGRISVFREQRFDFVTWINEEADRSDWPLRWVKRYSGSDAVPRRAYQQYLGDRLRVEQELSRGRVTISQEIGYVRDIEEIDGRWRVTMHATGKVIPDVDHVVLATGHLESRVPKVLQGFEGNGAPNCILDQYSVEGQKLLKGLRGDEEILVLGTGLRAFDVPQMLLCPAESNRRPHRGKIRLLSRGGHTHRSYPADHVHRVIDLPKPPILDNLEKIPPVVDEYVKVILQVFERWEEYVRQRHPEIPEVVRRERILKAAEPLIAEALRKIPEQVKQALLARIDEHWSHITVSRVGVVHEIGQLAHDPGEHVEVLAAEVTREVSIPAGQDTRFKVTCKLADGTESTGEYDVIVCSIGREVDYSRVRDELWRKLIDERQYATPDLTTRRGIRVGPSGELVDGKSRYVEHLTAVGLPREGDEITRHGRLGSFVFALGPIKNQAFGSALRVLRAVGDYGEPLPGFAYWEEQPGTYLSRGEAVTSAIVNTWKERGGRDGEKVDQWKIALTDYVDESFQHLEEEVIKAMRRPHSPVVKAVYQRIWDDLGKVLSPRAVPADPGLPEFANLAYVYLVAQLEEAAMRFLTDISDVEPHWKCGRRLPSKIGPVHPR